MLIETKNKSFGSAKSLLDLEVILKKLQSWKVQDWIFSSYRFRYVDKKWKYTDWSILIYDGVDEEVPDEKSVQVKEENKSQLG